MHKNHAMLYYSFFNHWKEVIMGKPKDTKKETKKEPAKTPKEKKEAKKQKKAGL